jgi:hypothetical protein
VRADLPTVEKPQCANQIAKNNPFFVIISEIGIIATKALLKAWF